KEFQFRCTDMFVRKFYHQTLNWSKRCATKASQKTPHNWEDQCYELILRVAHAIKEENIPAALIVNTDQTGINYTQGANLSWAATGSKQVPVVGQEEKRAFTLVVSVFADGTLLPFQAVFRGKSVISCPNANAPRYTDANKAGFKFVFFCN
ncbi:hypothetical protein M422DRAFT_186282, partial [Sphaerobolus stellatus SS14]